MTQSTTERRTRERTHGPACTADLCQQGRAACPCPQACELPGAEADPLSEEPSTAFELVTMWLVIAVLACGVVLAIRAFASA